MKINLLVGAILSQLLLVTPASADDVASEAPKPDAPADRTGFVHAGFTGAFGRNFAAGMSGGLAYVYDPAGQFAKHCNMAMVGLEPVLSEVEQTGVEQELIAQGKGRKRHLGLSDEAIVKSLVEKHLRYTGSTVALTIMDDWATHRKHFVKVFPHEYKRALTDMYAESIKSKSASRETVAK